MSSPRDPAFPRSIGVVAVALLVLLLSASCEVDNELVTDVGTALLFVQDSDIGAQEVAVNSGQGTFPVGDFPIQAADFAVTEAWLTVAGTRVNLLFGDACRFVDTSAVLATGVGKCAGGVVLDADGVSREVTLDIKFTLDVKRAQPVNLPPGVGGDYDGDRVPNDMDNCPLIDNPDQFDTGSKGFGDACAGFDPVFGISELDSDRDGVTDATDNCVDRPNRDQSDAGIDVDDMDRELVLPDGIGDACTEQSAEVTLNGNREIALTLGPIDLVQPFRSASLLTVDLRSAGSLALCDVASGSCNMTDMDAEQIRFCVLTAFGACP